VKHFLDVLDELNRLNVEYVSFREQIDTGGPLGRAVVVIIGAIAELERNLIIERVRAGMRRQTRGPAHRAQTLWVAQSKWSALVTTLD
jgi:DNA invertase Pin-like site-specific DNA recombinase